MMARDHFKEPLFCVRGICNWLPDPKVVVSNLTPNESVPGTNSFCPFQTLIHCWWIYMLILGKVILCQYHGTRSSGSLIYKSTSLTYWRLQEAFDQGGDFGPLPARSFSTEYFSIPITVLFTSALNFMFPASAGPLSHSSFLICLLSPLDI